MVYPSKFGVYFQCNSRKVLVFLGIVYLYLVQLHMNCVDTKFHVTNALQTKIKTN